MNYSLGYSFNIDEIMHNFPNDKLIISCKECAKITGDIHREKLIQKIFKESIYLVLMDIIHNNVTFILPVYGLCSCKMKMKRIQGEAFKNLRRGGKWKDVDIFASMFSGYQIYFYMEGRRTPREKPVYINKHLTKLITEYTNKGVSYGDGKCDKTIKDYYEQIYEKFPEVPQKDIQRVLNFSWKSLYLHNSYGGDTHIFSRKFWMHIGTLKKHSLDHFYYYIKKLTVKLRVMNRKKRVPWDGYYYFALNEQRYKEYLEQKKCKRRKYFTFKSILLYRLFDECRIAEVNHLYIFRIPILKRLRFKEYISEITTDKAEFIMKCNPAKFKDILVFENDYNSLCRRKH